MEQSSLSLRLPNPNLRALVGPGVLALILVVLFGFLFKNGYSQISRQLNELKVAIKNESTLEEKVRILKEVRAALESTDRVVTALPYKNPALWAISQLKRAAEVNSVVISRIGLTNERQFEQDLTRMEISLDLETDGPASIVSFIKTVWNLAPVTTLESVDIKEKLGGISSEIKLSVFWSPLPSSLPPISAPAKELSTKEEELLDKILALTQPEFATIVPSEPTIRENPFN